MAVDLVVDAPNPTHEGRTEIGFEVSMPCDARWMAVSAAALESVIASMAFLLSYAFKFDRMAFSIASVQFVVVQGLTVGPPQVLDLSSAQRRALGTELPGKTIVGCLVVARIE